MLDWLKNKKHPEFWKNYSAKFSKKSNRYVAISIQTTGLNSKKDVILSIGGVAIIDNSIRVGDAFEISIQQFKYLHDNNLENTYFEESNKLKLTEPVAISNFIDYIGNATLIGHRVHFDIEILNEALEKLECGRLKNEALDIEIMYKKLHDIGDKNFSIEDLSVLHKLPKSDRISTSDDAFSIALLFLKLKTKLGL